MAEKKQSKADSPSKTGTGGKGTDPWDILVYPHLTEKSMNMVEFENKLIFIVNKKATKKEIKDAVEKQFEIKVDDVRTEITTKGHKKAFVHVNPEYSAADIASKLGMI